MDTSSWSVIVREHGPLVWQTVGRLLPDPADAADCFQETFVAAWRFSNKQAVERWPGFLQRVATARALDRLRKRRRHSQRHPTSVDLSLVASVKQGPLERAHSTELATQLRDALATLPAAQSQAFCLRHLNGFSYEQIAQELSISVSAVGVNLHRAGRRLREKLALVQSAPQNEPGEL